MARTAQINVNVNTKEAQGSSKALAGSIGEVGDRTHSLRAELKQMKEALLELDEGSEKFQELAYNAAQLQDAIGDVNARVKILSSDTLALDQSIGVIQGLAGGFQAAQGAAALLGVENEDLLKVLTRLQATQAVINGLQQVANMLNKDSAAGILLRNTYTKILNGLTITQTAATGGATVATRALGVAMNALPILAIIGGITALIAAFSSMSSEAESAKEKLEQLNKTNLDSAKLQLFQLKEANSELEQELRKIDLAVLEGVKTEKDANEEKKKLLNERIDLLAEEVKSRKAGVGAIIFAMEQTGELEKVEGELYNDKVKRLKEYLLLQGEEDDALKAKAKKLETYLQTVDSEIKARETLANITKNEGKTSEQNAKAAADAAKKRLELIFMIANQERINELERLKRQENILIEEGATDEEILAKKQEVNDKEKEISNAKYEFLLKEAKGNTQKIKLLELQRIGELEKLEENYRNNLKKFDDEREEREKQRIAKEKQRANESIKAKNDALIAEAKLREIDAIKEVKTENRKQADIEKEKIAIRKQFAKEILDLQIQQIKDERDIALQNTELTEEQKQKIIAESNLKIAELNKGFLEEFVDETEKTFQELMQEIANITSQAFSAINGLMMAFSDLSNTQMENDAIARENAFAKESEALESQLANRMISQEEFDSKMATIEADKERQDLIAKRKAFQQDKQMRIAQATMGMAQAIIQGLAAPFPMNIVMAALAGVTGAIQIAAIKQQQFRAAKGGVVPGQPSNTDSVDAKLAPGEMVINSQSAGMFPQTLSAINQMGGGISLAPEVPLVPGTTSVFEGNRNEERPMIKTYVVSSEIKEGLDTDERIRAGATF
jgi:hypothetical protein